MMTSRDVIHSFYVPAFRIKQDVVPGRMTTAVVHRDRARARTRSCARSTAAPATRACAAASSRCSPPTTRAWARERVRRRDLAATGEKLAADYGCLRCHTVDGTPHLGPTWKGLYGSTMPLDGGRHGPRRRRATSPSR